MTDARTPIHVRSRRDVPERRHLLGDLEQLLRVTIRPAGSRPGPGEASVWFDLESAELAELGADGGPLLAHVGAPPGSRAPAEITFSASQRLDRRLRGATFELESTPWTPLPSVPGDEVLAVANGMPVWVQRRIGNRRIDVAGVQPESHDPSPTWQRQAERLVTAIPLVHFARGLARYDDAARPVRACFLIDDPNLHWPTYGHLDYRELVAAASGHGFHASIATIPLDSRIYHPEVVRLFHRNPELLSLAMHGNNHTRGEFSSAESETMLRSVAQSIRRIERFERRSGLRVDRVVVPPHGAMSERLPPVTAALGLDAVTASPWSIAAAVPGPRDGLGITPTAGGRTGSPLLVRRHMVGEDGWLPLHAFLDQPVIIYLHHDDLAGGLEVMGDIATRVDRMGAVRWCSLGEMIRSSYAMHPADGVATVTMYATRVSVPVPAGIREMVIEHPKAEPATKLRVLDGDHEVIAELGSSIDVRPDAVVTASLEDPSRIDPETVPLPSRSPWPVLRRVLTEARDRLHPLVSRA